MNILQLLLVAVGFVASAITFVVLRHPHARREGFRHLDALSLPASSLGAAIVFAVFVALALLEG